MVRYVRRWLGVSAALLVLPAWAQAQDGEPVTITGRVTGEAGEPLTAANVRIVELNLVTYVGPDGSYRLVVPGARAQNQTLALSARMIGRLSRSVNVRLAPGSTISQNFVLPADPLRLEEVVVTGAGTQALAERIGTARASVSSAEVTRSNETNVITALAGKIPNVVTSQGSGDAGSSTSIQIRGNKTFGASQPLVVVDGIPVSNNTRAATGVSGSILSGPPTPNRAVDINPADIESIEILKGAAATSIYGASAGSAGAILITTKKGRPGRTQYSVRSTYQSDKPVKFLPVQQSFGMGQNGLSTACTTVNCAVDAGFFSWGPALPAGTPVYDHGREIYETGTVVDNAISMSGGSERTTFYVSGTQLRHDGFIVTSNDLFTRYTGRFSGSHQISDALTIGAGGQYVQTRQSGIDRSNSVNGIGLTAMRQPPEFNAQEFVDPTTGLHRSFRFPNPGPTAFTTNRRWDNPLYAIRNHKLLGETGRVLGNVNANWRALEWLQFNWTLGADYNSDDRSYAYDQSASGTPAGIFGRWQFYDRILDHTLTGTANWELNRNVSGGLTVGQNLNETYFRQIDVVAQTWIAPQPFKLSNTVSRDLPSDSETRRRVEGYFAQANADLFNQLYLQARVRNDGNSAFSVGEQRATYPGGSVAWSFTKAVDLPENVISFGKLRLAYGESGQQPPLYTQQDIYTTAAFADFNPGSLIRPSLNSIGGLFASATKGNPVIKPERVSEVEGGIDLNLFRGALDLSVTRYDSKSEDVVFATSLAPSTGYTSIQSNAGSMTNKGWELSTAFRPVQRQDFSIELGANWGQNRNKVTSLGLNNPQAAGLIDPASPENCRDTAILPRCQIGFGSSFSGQSTHAQVGYPIGVWRGNDFARCGRGLTTVTFAGTSHNVGAACQGAPDGALYIAANGFPITDPNTRAIGNPWPDWTGGLSAYVTFRGVEFSAFLDHREGGNVLNMTRGSMSQFGTHKDTEVRGTTVTFGQNMVCHNITCNVLNGPVVGPGAGTAVVLGEGWWNSGTLGNGQGAVGGPISTRIEDATNTRLREISVGYSFRGDWLQRIAGMRQADVKLSGRNLKLWTDYSGTDPEVNAAGAANANRGIDWWVPPLARAMVISVSLTH